MLYIAADATDEPYPAAKNYRLLFYVKTDQPGVEFRRVLLTLSTTGGICKKHVGKQFKTFFKTLDLPTEFRWDAKYWPLKPARVREEEDAEDEDVE